MTDIPSSPTKRSTPEEVLDEYQSTILAILRNALRNWQHKALSPAPVAALPEFRELLCEKCGRDYPVWFTDNALWNRVAAEDFHFLCMDCFALIAEERGEYATPWYLTPGETATDGTVLAQIANRH